MLGVEDPGTWIPYLICIATALFFMIYGIVTWNEGKKHIDFFNEEDKVED